MISDINSSLGGRLVWATVQFAIAQHPYLRKCEAQSQELNNYNSNAATVWLILKMYPANNVHFILLFSWFILSTIAPKHF